MTSFSGALRGALCLIIEHPMDSIKTQWQNKLHIKTIKHILQNILYEKGLIGFYRGFIPNLVRVSIKQLYRWPMMLYFPRLYKKYLNGFVNDNSGIIKILTGITIANIEILIICPLDRLKIFFMTNDIAKSNLFLYFINKYKNKLTSELFAGLGPSYWRSNISWVSFLYLDFKCKKILKSYKNTDELRFIDLLLVSVIVGCGNLITTIPFDFVKTQCQKDNNLKGNTLSIIKFFYRKFGIHTLYIGWQFKLMQYTIQSVFTVTTLENLEKISKKL